MCLLMFCPFMLFTVQIACCAIDYPLRYRQMHVQDIWPVETRSKYNQVANIILKS